MMQTSRITQADIPLEGKERIVLCLQVARIIFAVFFTAFAGGAAGMVIQTIVHR